MSDEEWNSSFEYYALKQEEANLALQIAKDKIIELYAPDINNVPWYIDFEQSTLNIGKEQPQFIQRLHPESYSDYLRRLYASERMTKIQMNGPHAKEVTLQVTESCNMACTYCYQHHKTNNIMSFDTAKQIIDMILDADQKTNSYITSTQCDGVILSFIGGEPWLAIDLITQISDYFIGELFRRQHPWATRFKFSICSNGLLHFEPKVQSYLHKHIRHLSYNVSIDGNKTLHDTCRLDLNGEGTYDRAIAAVRDYKNTFHGNMGSKMTLAPQNIHQLFSSVTDMIEQEGYRSINLNCVFEEGWTIEHANILYWELHKLTDWLKEKNLIESVYLSIFSQNCGKPLNEKYNQNWCGGAGLMLAANYQGNFYPCLRYMESSTGNRYEPYVIGTVEEGINCAPKHQERINCLSCITRRSQSTDECYNCPIAMGCGWCSAYNYEVYGTPDQRTTFTCIMHQARTLANVYYWSQRQQEYPMYCPAEWAIKIIGENEYKNLQEMGECYGEDYR